MLRILRIEVEGNRVVLVLQGHIVAEWVELLESECADALRAGLFVSLDLARVPLIGPSGVEALRRLAGAGVEIRGCSPLIADTLEIEGIEVCRVPDGASDGKPPGNGRRWN